MVVRKAKTGVWQHDLLEIVREINDDMSKRINRDTVKMS